MNESSDAPPKPRRRRENTAIRSLQEVAEIMGISKQMVSYHEQCALKKLRRALEIDETNSRKKDAL